MKGIKIIRDLLKGVIADYGMVDKHRISFIDDTMTFIFGDFGIRIEAIRNALNQIDTSECKGNYLKREVFDLKVEIGIKEELIEKIEKLIDNSSLQNKFNEQSIKVMREITDHTKNLEKMILIGTDNKELLKEEIFKDDLYVTKTSTYKEKIEIYSEKALHILEDNPTISFEELKNSFLDFFDSQNFSIFAQKLNQLYHKFKKELVEEIESSEGINLKSLTIPELKEFAKNRNIKLDWNLTLKNEFIKEIQKNCVVITLDD